MRRIIALLLAVSIVAAGCGVYAETASQTLDASLAAKLAEALGEPLYVKTCEYLAAGNTIAYDKHYQSDAIEGLQLLLGSLGRAKLERAAYRTRTMGLLTCDALHQAQRVLGDDETQSVDMACFTRLMSCLLAIRDETKARKLLLGGGMSEAEFRYLYACGAELTGLYYTAYTVFTELQMPERAEACVQEWPENKQIYRSPDHDGNMMRLTISIEAQNKGCAALAKLYCNGEYVSALFIGGSGSVTAGLPSGLYTIKMGTGDQWFGLPEAFGRLGSYQTMLFDQNSTEVQLDVLHEYQLTVNTTTSNSEAKDVGAEREEWEGF